MGDFLLLGLRILAGASGLLLIAAAAFLYEGEEKQVQSVLEDWWVRIDDLGRTAVSRHVAFYSVVAAKTEGILNRILGGGMPIAQTILRFPLLAAGSFLSILGASAGNWRFFLAGSAVGALSLSTPTVLFGVLAAGFLLLAVLEPSVVLAAAVLFVALLVIGVLNFPLIHFLRAALQEASDAPRGSQAGRWSIFLLPVLAGLAAFLLLGLIGGILFGASEIVSELGVSSGVPERFDSSLQTVRYWFSGAAGRGLVTLVCLVPLLVTFLYSIVAVALLFNRWIWPLPNRLLYAVQRLRLLENRGLLWKVGVAMLTVAAMPWASALEAVGAYF